MRRGMLPVESLVGEIAATPSDAAALMQRVVAGELTATAATIDWSFAR
jgi:hypothetical protein